MPCSRDTTLPCSARWRSSPGDMVIGPEEEVDMALEYRNVSRWHAQIDSDGNDYRVTDLPSTNGTCLANMKLMLHR